MDLIFKFLIPSHPRYLAVIRAAVGELGLVCGLPDEESRGIALAVDEALANVIRHAYRSDPGQPIEVSCHAWTDRLEFTLLDQGEPPDPVRLRAPPLDEMALGGRGTHIIRSIMDEVCYERVPRGNQLRLRKRLPGAMAVAERQGKDV